MNILERLQHDIKAPFKFTIIKFEQGHHAFGRTDAEITLRTLYDFPQYLESITCSECGHIKDPEPEPKPLNVAKIMNLADKYVSASFGRGPDVALRRAMARKKLLDYLGSL